MLKSSEADAWFLWHVGIYLHIFTLKIRSSFTYSYMFLFGKCLNTGWKFCELCVKKQRQLVRHRSGRGGLGGRWTWPPPSQSPTLLPCFGDNIGLCAQGCQMRSAAEGGQCQCLRCHWGNRCVLLSSVATGGADGTLHGGAGGSDLSTDGSVLLSLAVALLPPSPPSLASGILSHFSKSGNGSHHPLHDWPGGGSMWE